MTNITHLPDNLEIQNDQNCIFNKLEVNFLLKYQIEIFSILLISF